MSECRAWQFGEKLTAFAVDPLHVIDEQQQRLAWLSQGQQQALQDATQIATGLARAQLAGARRRAIEQRRQGRHQPHQMSAMPLHLGPQQAAPVLHLLRRLGQQALANPDKQRSQRFIGLATTSQLALGAGKQQRLCVVILTHPPHQRGFADTGLALQQQYSALPQQQFLASLTQYAQLSLTTDQPRRCLCSAVQAAALAPGLLAAP